MPRSACDPNWSHPTSLIPEPGRPAWTHTPRAHDFDRNHRHYKEKTSHLNDLAWNTCSHGVKTLHNKNLASDSCADTLQPNGQE